MTLPDPVTPTSITYSLQDHVNGGDLGIRSLYMAACDRRGLCCSQTLRGRVRPDAQQIFLAAATEIIAHHTVGHDPRIWGTAAMFGEAAARLSPGEESDAFLTVTAATPAAVDVAVAMLAPLLVEARRPDDGASVEIRMWHKSENSFGPTSTQRRISALSPHSLDKGLSAGARQAMQELRERGVEQGGAHVWHGPPGCGKTSAIRSVAREWAREAFVELILDPATFLADADYMMHVLRAPDPSRTIATPYEQHEGINPARRVLVLEDSGQLISRDAVQRAGSLGISRLLNLTDGMFGEQHRPIVIITTNEEIGRLHPAITRPGRCRSVIKFEPLSLDEARAWLDDRGRDSGHLMGPTTIAELVAAVDDTAPVTSQQSHQIGFFS